MQISSHIKKRKKEKKRLERRLNNSSYYFLRLMRCSLLKETTQEPRHIVFSNHIPLTDRELFIRHHSIHSSKQPQAMDSHQPNHQTKIWHLPCSQSMKPTPFEKTSLLILDSSRTLAIHPQRPDKWYLGTDLGTQPHLSSPHLQTMNFLQKGLFVCAVKMKKQNILCDLTSGVCCKEPE